LALIPHVAESFRIIDDNTYEFTLRDDVVFHHGEKLTSRAREVLDRADPGPGTCRRRRRSR
jgi:MarR-like DNA-binding transcriptional regulator SgrR of sgrS sRNA